MDLKLRRNDHESESVPGGYRADEISQYRYRPGVWRRIITYAGRGALFVRTDREPTQRPAPMIWPVPLLLAWATREQRGPFICGNVRAGHLERNHHARDRIQARELRYSGTRR